MHAVRLMFKLVWGDPEDDARMAELLVDGSRPAEVEGVT